MQSAAIVKIALLHLAVLVAYHKYFGVNVDAGHGAWARDKEALQCVWDNQKELNDIPCHSVTPRRNRMAKEAFE